MYIVFNDPAIQYIWSEKQEGQFSLKSKTKSMDNMFEELIIICYAYAWFHS